MTYLNKQTPSDEFTYDVFLSHSAKDKTVVRDIARRLKKDGVSVWLDEEQIKPGDSIPAKIEEGLERSRVLVLCMSANAFGSDWSQLESHTFRFRDPLNKNRRFIPLRLDNSLIKGSLAQFHYINWLSDHEEEYDKLFEACSVPTTPAVIEEREKSSAGPSNASDDYSRRRRDTIQQVFAAFEMIHAFFFKVCIDYLSLVEVLHAGLTATDADRTKYYQYIEEIGRRLHEMHILEGRLRLVDAEPAVQLMQKYRLQAIEVNDMLQLQQPKITKREVNAVTEELFRRKDQLYKELAKALRIGSSEEIQPPPVSAPKPASYRIGDSWSGLRGVLQEAYSTKIIKGILGKAGLPISKIDYTGTFKGPVLDEADKMVSSMDDFARDRFAIGCIQEIVAFERVRTANFAERGVVADDQTLRALQQVLTRFGHDLKKFEPA